MAKIRKPAAARCGRDKSIAKSPVYVILKIRRGGAERPCRTEVKGIVWLQRKVCMKRMAVFLSAVLLSALTGCAELKNAADNWLEEKVMERSGIQSEESYRQYRELSQEGKLDAEGYYLPEKELAAEAKPAGSIHVTFATNGYLKIKYYRDEALTEPISTDNCYLDPGDGIYAATVISTNPNSNLYRLAEYRIRAYDEDGALVQSFAQKAGDGPLVWEIPRDFSGTELSVLPVGIYPDRSLSLNVYYTDADGEERSLSTAGEWYINGEKSGGTNVKISAIESYALRFDYDEENYFFVGCEPACFTKDPVERGFVEFWAADPTDEDTVYSVELSRYLSLSLRCSEQAAISVNNGEKETVRKNKVWRYDKLKYGDIVTIETAGGYEIVDGDYRYISDSDDPVAGGHRYSLRVEAERGRSDASALQHSSAVVRTYTVTLDSNARYGVCSYRLDKEETGGQIRIRENQSLKLTYKLTDENYVFADEGSGGGVLGFFRDLIGSRKRTVEIPFAELEDGGTIRPDEWFHIVRKGD